MRPCPSEDALAAFVERRLPDRAPIEAHLDACGSCRRVVAHLVALSAARRPTAAPAAEPTATAPGAGASPAAPAMPAPGDKVARYVVERELGRGGMGVVFAAFDPALHRRIALKLVRPDEADPTSHARMTREARAMASLAHPNVVTIHDVGELPDGQMFLAMELVEGRTLRAALREPRSLAATLDLFVQAGRGLAAAHGAGLVHRDFKPDNVLVGKDGRVRVTDFGIVRGAAEEQGMTLVSGGALTASGAVLGTPAYMAPEQHVGLAASAQADQFAFAVALYEALAGSRPFAGSTYDEIRTSKLHHGRSPWPASAAVPDALRAGIDRALARDPAARHPRIEDLIAILEQARDRAAGLATLAAALPVAAAVAPAETVAAPPTHAARPPAPVAPRHGAMPTFHATRPAAAPAVPGWLLPAIGGALVLAVVVVLAVTKLASFAAGSARSAPTAAAPSDGSEVAPPPVPTFTPIVRGATLGSVLPCPPGAEMRRLETSRWLYCAEPHGELEGPSLWFHKNGLLQRQESNVRGHRTGRVWSFDDEGRLTEVAEYTAGELDGVRLEIHANGRVRTEHHYRRGVMHGLVRAWNKDGRLDRWARYEDGKLAEARRP